MATQVRIRRRGRIRAFVVASCAAAFCLVPSGVAFADTTSSTSRASSAFTGSETQGDALLPMETDVAVLVATGLAALGIGSLVVKKAGI